MPVEKFLVIHNTDIETYEKIKYVIENSKKFIAIEESRNYKSINILLRDLASYVKATFMELDGFELVNGKIVHFENVMVSKEYKEELLKKIEEVEKLDVLSNEELASILHRLRGREKLLIDLKHPVEGFEDLTLRKILQHYYIPLIYADRDLDWIKHVVKTKSEYEFIEALLGVVDELDKIFDWWFFSKLDEHLDKDVYLPYQINGKIAKFIPDFIFWCKFKEGNDYLILFIDPKSANFTDYQAKVDGLSLIHI